jgi:hypothetical protein
MEKLRCQMESLKLPLVEIPEARLAGTEELITVIEQQVPVPDLNMPQPTKLMFVPCMDTVSLGKITEESKQMQIEQPLVSNQDVKFHCKAKIHEGKILHKYVGICRNMSKRSLGLMLFIRRLYIEHGIAI